MAQARADGDFPPRQTSPNFGKESVNAIMDWLDGSADGLKVQERRIDQRRGPAIKFIGALIAKTEFALRDGSEMRLELYETQGGALIPVTIGVLETRATVVEWGREWTMRCAVIEAFDWHGRARTMVKDQLNWDLVREVE